MERVGDTTMLRRLCECGVGYIFTDYSGDGPRAADYNKLHHASCRKLLEESHPVTDPPKKFFCLHLDTALRWLNQTYGEEGQKWSRCNLPGRNCFR